MLPVITGEFGVVADPELRFSDKGNAWLKVRGVAKDRVRDANGNWSDGPALFIDIIMMGKAAENLAESVSKGDSIVVQGRLEPSEWTDKEGNKQTSIRLRVEEAGVSVRWNAARTPRTIEATGGALDTLGATPVDESTPPF